MQRLQISDKASDDPVNRKDRCFVWLLNYIKTEPDLIFMRTMFSTFTFKIPYQISDANIHGAAVCLEQWKTVQHYVSVESRAIFFIDEFQLVSNMILSISRNCMILSIYHSLLLSEYDSILTVLSSYFMCTVLR